jgi:glyoxylase-like metal-dependent hydrolase (beta-lactamase superfamily II)
MRAWATARIWRRWPKGWRWPWTRAGTRAPTWSWPPRTGCGWRSPPTPTCTRTSSPAAGSWPGWGRGCSPPAGSGLRYPNEELRDGQELDLGGLTLRALATPGHLAYLLADGAAPVVVFTGGALIAGGVARTNLADPARAEAWTRAAYRSARSLLDGLPEDLPAYPTHGSGSFCSAGEPGEHTTTIGREKTASPLLAETSEDAFAPVLLARLVGVVSGC